MTRIGIVCEGSHDFCFLVPVIDQILIERGSACNVFDSLQPKIDATSRQLDGGGYEAVRQWLLSAGQSGLSAFFQQGLFSSSVTYDAIVVHLDGDVADISPAFASSVFAGNFHDVADRAKALSGWIKSLANVDVAYNHNLITAIPVLQMEAWVMVGLGINARRIEKRNFKRAAKRVLGQRFVGPAVKQVQDAALEARGNLSQMRVRAQSFRIFIDEFEARFASEMQ